MIEILVAAAIVLGGGYVAVVRQQRISDPLVEGLVVAAAFVMFGDQYPQQFGSAA